MPRLLSGEKFEEITFPDPLQNRYAISNKGRMMSFRHSIADGTIISGSICSGYNMFRYQARPDGSPKIRNVFRYRLVAENFLPPPTPEQLHLLHLDHNKANDTANNLKWATAEEKRRHYVSNPKVIKARAALKLGPRVYNGRKLTMTDALRLKKILLDPNRQTHMKELAKLFGVSMVQLTRIKNGTNWGHLKV